MTDHRPLVSIITPSYNQGRFIEETLVSVRDQDYPNVEHLVIDGASKDETPDVLARYAGTYDMRWASEPDKGHADALRKGFGQAKGEILAWLNSDDVYLPGAITRAVDALTRPGHADLVYGDVVVIDGDGASLGIRRLTYLDEYDFLVLGNCLAQPATFWTREVYDRVGGIDDHWYFQMDLDYFIRVAQQGRIEYIPGLLAKIRMHPDGKMVKADDVRKTELVELRQRHLRPRGMRGRLLCRPDVLWTRQFLRYVRQGDVAYAGGKLWQRILDRDLFRDSRR